LSKKTTEIIIDSKNDYLIAVKKNQKKLYELLELKRETLLPADVDSEYDKTRDREVTRTVEVFDNISCLNQKYWKGLKSIICCTREGIRGSKPYIERVYFTSSIATTAKEFNQRIREHWLIENQLHWTKDVIFEEDKSRIRSGNAPQNFSIIRNIVINIMRKTAMNL
jgi:predicted transposase YbfD/YdcC